MSRNVSGSIAVLLVLGCSVSSAPRARSPGDSQAVDSQPPHAVVHAVEPAPGELLWLTQIGGTDVEQGNAVASVFTGGVVVSGGSSGEDTLGVRTRQEPPGGGFVAQFDYVRQRPLWAVRVGWDLDSGKGVVALPDGSVFGIFETFQTPEGQLAPSSSSALLTRFDADGRPMWSKAFGGHGWTRALGVAATPDGSTLVVGALTGEGTFGYKEANETTLTSLGETEAFLARFNPAGEFLWVRRVLAAGGMGESWARAVAVAADGSVIVVGGFEGRAVFDRPGETRVVLEAHDDILHGGEAFVARYLANGDIAWAVQAGGKGNDAAYAVDTFADGDLVVGGVFTDSATFGDRGIVTVDGAGETDAFVARYTSDGQLVWATRAGGSKSDSANGVAAMPDGTVRVVGGFFEVASFGVGNDVPAAIQSHGHRDAFVASLTHDGKWSWGHALGGSGEDTAFDCAAVGDGTLLATGYFNDVATFAPDAREGAVLTSKGGPDLFVARFGK